MSDPTLCRALADRALAHPRLLLLVALAGVLTVARLARGDERPFIYPADGQSESRLAEDRYACHRDAVHRSAYDPVTAALEPPLRSAPVRVPIPPNEKQGATAKGVLTGAVAGGVIGAATDNHPGEIAVAGAVLGGIIGGAVESDGARAAEEEAEAEADARMRDQRSKLSAAERRRTEYRNTFAACMAAQHYVVR
jgi:uncharacterized protein YcfJ